MPYPDSPLTLAALGPELAPYLKGAPALYMTGEESLRLRSFCSLAGVTLALEGRILHLDGSISPISGPHVCNADRSAAETVHAIGPGWLQHVSVRAIVGAPLRGQCFAVVEVVRGRDAAMQPLGVVAQGYAFATSGLAWPGSPIVNSVDGPGLIRSIAGTNPAAGAEWSETVPTNARWRLLGVNVEFTTDATAANRELVVTIDDGAAILAEIASGSTQIASTVRRYSLHVNVQRGVSAGTTTIQGPLPDAFMLAGYRVRSVTTNLQAGDNWGAPQLWVEEWIED